MHRHVPIWITLMCCTRDINVYPLRLLRNMQWFWSVTGTTRIVISPSAFSTSLDGDDVTIYDGMSTAQIDEKVHLTFIITSSGAVAPEGYLDFLKPDKRIYLLSIYRIWATMLNIVTSYCTISLLYSRVLTSWPCPWCLEWYLQQPRHYQFRHWPLRNLCEHYISKWHWVSAGICLIAICW